ncbi:MAG: hypothetical protein AAGB31_11475 [Bdellovibrio sp.]
MKRVTFGMSLLCGIFLAGCGQQIENLVKNGPQRLEDETPTPTPSPSPSPSPGVSSDNALGLRVSSGAVLAEGSQVKAHLTMSPHHKVLQGSNIQGKISINQTRPQ